MNVLQVQSLNKSFSTGFRTSVQVLNNVSFEVKEGVVTGFLGANGAGKTTTLKCIFDLIRPTSGEVLFFGNQAFDLNVRKKIGFLPERPYFYEYLTGFEFLKFYGDLIDEMTKSELVSRIMEVLEKVDLIEAKDRALRDYSKGMLQRIGIAQTILGRPKLIVLDEPMAGLDPDGRAKLSQLIREVASEGTSVFFSSHLLHDVESLCKELVILKKGQIVYTGSLDSFLSRMDSGFEVVTENDGRRAVQEIKTQAELQEVLKTIVDKRQTLIEVKRLRPNLEEAFVRISFGEEE